MAASKKAIHAVVGIIIDVNTNKVLISKRRPEQSYAGYWEFPGGKITPKESILEALQRELNEELNITFNQAVYLNTIEYSYPEFDVRLEVYKVTKYSGEVISNEGQELRWSDIPDLKYIDPLLPGSFDLLKLISDN